MRAIASGGPALANGEGTQRALGRTARGWTWLARASIFVSLGTPAAMALGSFSTAFAFTPGEIERGAPLDLLGIHLAPCPGCAMCGMSRAFSALSHGDVASAIAYNAMVVVVYPALFVAMTVCLWALVQLARRPLELDQPKR